MIGYPALVVFMRHAQSVGNVISRHDPKSFETPPHKFPLTDLGIKQAEIAREYAVNRFGSFDTYFTSYYKRSKDTMKILYPDANPIEDSRLAEAQWGLWQSMPEELVRAKHPDEFERKNREDIFHYRAWGGESWGDIELRIQSFLMSLRVDHAGERVLIVGHGNWMLIFEKLIHGLSVEESVRRYKAKEVFKNCQMSVYEPRLVAGKENLVLVEGSILPWKGKI